MRTRDELERLWSEAPPEPRGRGTVRLICLRKGAAVYERPERAELSVERGVVGDRWATFPRGKPEMQVTLMSARVAELVAGAHAPLHAAGDNLLVDLDLSAAALPVGARLRVGGALLEVTPAPHTGCKKFSARFGREALAWVNAVPARRLRGVHCRVLVGGEVRVGDEIALVG